MLAFDLTAFDLSCALAQEKGSERTDNARMKRIVQAFFHSLDGFSHAARHERAVRQEIILLVIAVPLAFVLTQDPWRLALLIGSILIILAAEFLNTAIEKLADHVEPAQNPAIKIIKDLASAGVLMTLCVAGLIWLAALYARVFA
jgi:diacylglycerol kinase (ATP)